MQSLRGIFQKALKNCFGAFGLVAALLVAVPSVSFAGDEFAEGLTAFLSRHYSDALKHFRQAAEHGNSEAQFRIGAMYFNGHGVAQDRDEAARWFHKAAVHGNPGAQYILGVIYWDGRGVEKNYASSYMWFSIASANGDKRAAESESRIAANLSAPDISEARQRARVCMESKYQDCD